MQVSKNEQNTTTTKYEKISTRRGREERESDAKRRKEERENEE
jgi:hypothetical protein